MKKFEVFRKTDNQLVFEYTTDTDTMIEWADFPLTDFNYADASDEDVPVAPPPSGPVYEGRRKLTKLEWRKLLQPAEEEAFDEIRASVETMALPDTVPRALVRTFVNRYNEATVMDLDDSDQLKGFQLMVVLNKMDPTRIPVILRG